jgi:hypothetical protein
VHWATHAPHAGRLHIVYRVSDEHGHASLLQPGQYRSVQTGSDALLGALESTPTRAIETQLVHVPKPL